MSLLALGWFLLGSPYLPVRSEGVRALRAAQRLDAQSDAQPLAPIFSSGSLPADWEHLDVPPLVCRLHAKLTNLCERLPVDAAERLVKLGGALALLLGAGALLFVLERLPSSRRSCPNPKAHGE